MQRKWGVTVETAEKTAEKTAKRVVFGVSGAELGRTTAGYHVWKRYFFGKGDA